FVRFAQVGGCVFEKDAGEFMLDVGTPTGLTKSNCGFNPDKNGSYTKALKALTGKYSTAQTEAQAS
ncbi:MAG: hypothetical protein IKN27_13340, partial [Selenomonadaceae bacterium]|nr:hypothetical protein [Selenomonadaceae bacterium]